MAEFEGFVQNPEQNQSHDSQEHTQKQANEDVNALLVALLLGLHAFMMRCIAIPAANACAVRSSAERMVAHGAKVPAGSGLQLVAGGSGRVAAWCPTDKIPGSLHQYASDDWAIRRHSHSRY